MTVVSIETTTPFTDDSVLDPGFDQGGELIRAHSEELCTVVQCGSASIGCCDSASRQASTDTASLVQNDHLMPGIHQAISCEETADSSADNDDTRPSRNGHGVQEAVGTE